MKAITISLFLLGMAMSSCRHKPQTHYPAVKWENGQKLKYLTYGLPHPTTDANAIHVIASKWGFEYHSLTGCVINKKLVDSVNNHNHQVDHLLAVRYGKNWPAVFAKEVKQEFAVEQKINALLNKQPMNIAKHKQLKKAGSNLQYYISPATSANIYQAEATGPGKFNGQDTYVCYYKYLIDLNKNTVKLLSNNITKL